MRARYRPTPSAPWVLLHSAGALTGRYGGELELSGEAEHHYEAGSWCVAVSTFVIRRGGSVRRLP